jgi:hypothetical protein
MFPNQAAPQHEESTSDNLSKDNEQPDIVDADQEMPDADAESEDGDQNSDDSSSIDDGYIDRRDNKTIEAIDDSAFKNLLLHHLDPEGKLNVSICQIEERDGGTWHHVAILSAEGHGRFVIKVPFTGTAEWWQEGDAYNLRSEAQTMNYIRRNTSVPVPEVIAYDDSLNNPISAPYILMRAVEGRLATHAWYGRTPNGQLDKPNADNPSPATNQQRKRFLKSLAYTMAELRHLEFDKIGMLNFDGNADVPEVGPWFEDMQDSQQLKEIPAYKSSKEFYQSKIDYVKEKFELALELDDHGYGILELLSIVFEKSPFSSSKKTISDTHETFVLAHNDLDLQNIYVDDDFNIVGIIDWDLTVTAPRCVGYSSLPVFLREDWEPEYGLETARHMPWSLVDYRKIYAEYVMQATASPNGLGDGKYTAKSHMYYAAYSVGTYSKAVEYFAPRICNELAHLRALNVHTFLENFGNEDWAGADRARIMLKKGLAMLFSVESE